MRQDGLPAKTVKKWRATTQSNHRLPVTANTLTMALQQRTPTTGLLHHSDRGSQYAATGYHHLAHRARPNPGHVQAGELLRQRLCGELLRDTQA